jgi:predicted RNase H-like HicB family nuclease
MIKTLREISANISELLDEVIVIRRFLQEQSRKNEMILQKVEKIEGS